MDKYLEIKKIFVLFRCDYDRERMLIQFGLLAMILKIIAFIGLMEIQKGKNIK